MIGLFQRPDQLINICLSTGDIGCVGMTDRNKKQKYPNEKEEGSFNSLRHQFRHIKVDLKTPTPERQKTFKIAHIRICPVPRFETGIEAVLRLEAIVILFVTANEKIETDKAHK